MEQGSLPCPSGRVRGPCQQPELSQGGMLLGTTSARPSACGCCGAPGAEWCWQPPPRKRSPLQGSHPAAARHKPFAFCWPCLPCGQPRHLGEGGLCSHCPTGEEGKAPFALAGLAGHDRLWLSAATEGDGQGNRLLLAESRLSKTPN